MNNPYWDTQFFPFLGLFLKRLFTAFSGASLAADEVQIFTLACIAISCGFLGPLLILKRATMLANSLSHTILLGLAISYLIAAVPLGGLGLLNLLIGAFAAALLTAAATALLTRFCRLQEDASIGLVFTVLFALGVIVVTLYMRDVHLGVEAVIGNVDVLRMEDLALSSILAATSASLVLFLFWPMQTALFDFPFAKAAGLRCNVLHGMILFLTAASCIGAFRAVGVLLVLSFLVCPYLIARLFSNRLDRLLFLSPAIGILVSLIGVALSRHILTVSGVALSTGGMIAVLLALIYPLATLIKRLYSALPHAKNCNSR